MSARPSASDLKELTSFKESRCIYHADIKKENFLLDSNEEVWIIDFGLVGSFPLVFRIYAFFNIGKDFAASVGRKLGYKPSSIADVMVKISSALQQCGGTASLGMYSSSFTGT